MFSDFNYNRIFRVDKVESIGPIDDTTTSITHARTLSDVSISFFVQLLAAIIKSGFSWQQARSIYSSEDVSGEYVCNENALVSAQFKNLLLKTLCEQLPKEHL
jgi:hypothetical protein